MAVCCLEDGLSFTNFYAAQLWGKVAYHEFEGITVHLEEGQRILASAGGKPVLLLRNHGPVVMEVNSSPGLEGIEQATNIDVAGKIIAYVEKNQPAAATKRPRRSST